MYRKIEKELKAWKDNKKHTPLVIKGARQVGKSYSILKFANDNYKNVIEINFEKDIDIKQQFERSLRPTDILSYLKLRFAHKVFNEKETLIFLDEIQACPNAITSLKFLAQECPYDVIASGSMLGVAIAASTSYPVGYITTIELYPMDFEEFLYANNVSKEIISSLQNNFLCKTKVPEGIHQIMNEYLKKYIICGGMPAVVASFVETSDFQRTRILQQQILKDYHEDIAKYGNPNDKIRAQECFDAIPQQLAKENKKFQYKLIRSGGSARFYEASLQWLKDSGLILQTYRLKSIQEPIEAYKELNIFKVYLFDTGLLLSSLSIECSTAILNEENMIYKGAIYENLAAQMLNIKFHQLYYFEPSTRSEIDFILNYNNSIVPIEIKSSRNATSKSLGAYIDKYQPNIALKFSFNNVNANSKVTCFPLYMLMFL
ncbi:MAG: AAA family ATPase [Longicatena sp.]